ncbi:MAG: hypothetical protein ACO3E1_03315 [Flavobacteriales bacterium]
MLHTATDSKDLLWLIILTCIMAAAYLTLTAISFKVYKRVKRHYAIQYSLAKPQHRNDIEKEAKIIEKGFKTRLYLQLILALFLHVNFFFILGLMYDFFEWWYLYVTAGLFLISTFFTYRAFVYIDKRKARKSEDELIHPVHEH